MRVKRSRHSAPSDPRYFRGDEVQSKLLVGLGFCAFGGVPGGRRDSCVNYASHPKKKIRSTPVRIHHTQLPEDTWLNQTRLQRWSALAPDWVMRSRAVLPKNTRSRWSRVAPTS